MWIELQLKAFKVSFIHHPDVIFLEERAKFCSFWITVVLTRRQLFARPLILQVGKSCFPPNMTHLLQPMDLVVNAEVKSAMRRHRIQLLMSYFREYCSQCHLAQRATPRMPYPDFDPPPPSIIDGLHGMFDLRERLLLVFHSECWTLSNGE
jgi:hypothetical protein